jgi:DNA/RNA-binding domain of Phe-tRNA-synthetase-like protein
MNLIIDPIFQELGLEIHMGVLEFEVHVEASNEDLHTSMREAMSLRIEELMGEAASSDPVIAAVRETFKKCGKDPSRYRPSSEALTRRVIAGKGLESINNVVDAGNITSLMTGIPVGCYDMESISGDMTLRIGQKGETYRGIARTDINLEGLPILTDSNGPFGSPYSDSEHTRVNDECKQLLFVIYGLGTSVEHVEAAGEIADTLFSNFCQ